METSTHTTNYIGIENIIFYCIFGFISISTLKVLRIHRKKMERQSGTREMYRKTGRLSDIERDGERD